MKDGLVVVAVVLAGCAGRVPVTTPPDVHLLSAEQSGAGLEGQQHFTLLPLDWDEWQSENEKFDKRFTKVFLAHTRGLLTVTPGSTPPSGGYAIKCYVKTVGQGDTGESMTVTVRMALLDPGGSVLDEVSVETSVLGVRRQVNWATPAHASARADQAELAGKLADYLLYRTRAGWP